MSANLGDFVFNIPPHLLKANQSRLKH